MKRTQLFLLATINIIVASCNQAQNKAELANQNSGCEVERKPITYNFTIADLYPSEAERISLDPNHFNINGVIIDANFDAGAIRVKTDDEELDVQFNSFNMSSAKANDLRLAIKRGSSIKSICTRAGARTLDLVSATITSPSDF